MKKLLLLLAVVIAFTCTSVAAQYGSTSSSSQETTTTTTTKSKKSADSSAATLTGCLSKEPDANGNYMLSNGKFKKGVAVMPTDKVKEHAGHTVQLTGQWSGDKRSFDVASMKHISETCTMGPDKQ